MTDLGRVGVWTFAFDRLALADVRDAAREIEQLGYGALWIGEAAGRESLTHAALLLDATDRIVIASGIARIGERSPRVMRAAQGAVEEAHPGRYLLGLGGSNQLGSGRDPATAMADYLDQMAAAAYTPPAAAPSPIVLGAHSTAMLRLAAACTNGSHTYLVTPANTARARRVLGPAPILAAEQAVVLQTDPTAARTIARRHLAFYAKLPHFQANFEHAGLTPEDWQPECSDRLVDAVVAWGDETAIADRVQAHLQAGATHVCIQPLEHRPAAGLDTLRQLAPTLTALA